MKGAPAGFIELIEPLKAKAPSGGGGAVGFLDMIDNDEAAALEAERAEEEAWLRDAVGGLHKNAVLLENVVTCMHPIKDAWGFYVTSLVRLFRAVDQEETLVRFWIDSEVRNTTKSATLFREDSVRIQGVQYIILAALRDWLRTTIYKPILRKIVSNGGRGVKNVDSVALDIVRAINEKIATMPDVVQKTLDKISTAVSTRFPEIKRQAAGGQKAACVFLFLHVLTPAVVNPSSAGFLKEDIKERETLLVLAKIGRVIQKWVNIGLGDEDSQIPRSTSDSSLASLSQGGSSDDGYNRATSPTTPATPSGRSSGEQEVVRFLDLVFRTTGAAMTSKKPDAEEVAESRAVVLSVMKKNYKLLRELENSVDRKSTLSKHLGMQQGKVFANFTRQATVEDLRVNAKTAVFPEAMNADGLRAEQAMSSSFADFGRLSSGEFSMQGERFAFVPAQGLSGFLSSKFACDMPHLFSILNYAQFYNIGTENCRKFSREGLFKESRALASLALFPFLAFTGWGRASVGVNSSVARSQEYFLMVRLENSAEADGIDPKKSGSSDVRCICLCGMMAGWCSEAVGMSVHAVELQCTARGDKTCTFVIAAEAPLETHLKRLATELKLSVVPRVPTLSFAPSPAAEAPRSRLRSGEQQQIHSVTDALDALRICFLREATARDKKDRTASMTAVADRLRAGSIKKNSDKTPEKSKSPPPPLGRADSRTLITRTSLVGARAVSGIGGAAAVANMAPLNLSLREEPTSALEAGEVRVSDRRVVALRCKDFGANFLGGAQALVDSGLSAKKKSVRGKFPIEQMFAVGKVAAAHLYGMGLSNGDALAKASNVESPRSATTILEALKQQIAVVGWGRVSYSSSSFSTSDDVMVVCHVENSFEADDRLGSVWDNGSPTCMFMAGIISGFCSRAFGIRCACVEIDCCGCGSTRWPGRCSFLCTIPSTIVARVKVFLASADKEDIWYDLVGGLRASVFDENAPKEEDPAPKSPSPRLSGSNIQISDKIRQML